MRVNDHADIIVFPELTITGYPAEDLLLRADFITAANNAVYQLAHRVAGIALVISFRREENSLYNSAVVLQDGVMLARYRKQELPNYGVFDEQRYFSAGNQPGVFEFHGIFIGLTICEDVWKGGVIDATKQAGAELLLTLNASPFNSGKIHQREAVICQQFESCTNTPWFMSIKFGGQIVDF